MAAVVAAAACALVAAGCSSERDPDDPVDETPIGLGDDGPGTCLQFDDEVSGEVTSLPVIDCSVAHSHEIYAVADHPADVYPGFGELEDFARRTCLAEFEPFVGESPFDSRLFHSWLVPTLDSWNDDDDREILCVLGSHDGAPLVGSMRGSGA